MIDDRIKQQAKCRAKGTSWVDIAKLWPALQPDTIRRQISERFGTTDPAALARIVGDDGKPVSIGVTAGETINAEDVFARLENTWEKESGLAQRRAEQVIRFSSGPVALVGLGDFHIGGSGVDYKMMRRDIELVSQTDNMYALTLGDLVDGFILNWTLGIRLSTTVAISEEWAVGKWILDKLGAKHLVAVSGNHDAWALQESGVDILKSIIAPNTIYANDDCLVRVECGDNTRTLRLRHKWSGNTTANPTGGVEKLCRLDQDFTDGFGAHTHVSSLVRQFTLGGITRNALQLGSYKRIDEYCSRMGFPSANEFAAAAIVLWPDGRVLPTNNIEIAAAIVSQ